MSSRRNSRPAKPATEQPGNSFRYLYWRLSEKEFQQLCATLLREKYDSVRCHPVGMSDQGIDAVADGDVIFQVKWSSKLLQDPAAWLKSAIEDERPNIVRLTQEKWISRYVLMTSVAGTTTSRGTGSIQKLQKQLEAYTKEFRVRVECWWQADIDAEVDAAPDSVKWSYQEMLAGSDAMRYLIHGSATEGQAARMRDTALQVMAGQWREDARIKFSQVDMDKVGVAEMFVDVPATVMPPVRRKLPRRTPSFEAQAPGALAFLLDEGRLDKLSAHPLIFLVGVPGQGKSTLGQYLSQVHRAAILPGDMLGGRTPPAVAVPNPKLPLRVDLSDYGSWLAGQDPFGEDDHSRPARRRGKNQRSLERFLADFCSAYSGGRKVSVEDVQSLLARFPVLLVLDGLDEIPDPALRSIAVEEINAAVTRMGVRHHGARFQVLVTSRPNASGLAEPDGELFQVLRLNPLVPDLQSEFIDKWCDVNDVSDRARRDIRRTFLSRAAVEQVAELADNPMQLTILLFLINRKGDAVPTSLTPLYSDYMATLLDREVARKQIRREQVPLLQEITAFLGWHMHAGVETHPSADRMTRRDIETTLLLYFRATEGPEDQAEELLKAATDRFWALTSKVEGTFEFAVQPVREYFAARFLAEWAGRDRRDPLPKQEVLRQLIARPYWLNVARFYAGFASPNELAGLRYGLEDAIAANWHPHQERVAAWTLLKDGIFANSPRVQRDVARLMTDDLSVQLIAGVFLRTRSFPALSQTAGGHDVASALMDDLQASPGSPLTSARVAMLREHVELDKSAFLRWWLPQAKAASGESSQSDWLDISMPVSPVPADAIDADHLVLTSAVQCQAAMRAGVSQSRGSASDQKLLQAVLDGWCSDVMTPSLGSSEAGLLLHAMRPQWFWLSRGPQVVTGHLWTDVNAHARSVAWSRLIQLSNQYEKLRKAADHRGKGQRGTTEPWQNPARELARLHRPCWLAAEIAIVGAISEGTVGSGSVDRDGQPFGEQIDYGTFVIKVHGRPEADWWEAMHEQYSDPLSRRTWSLALLAAADADTVISNLARVDTCLSGLSDDDFLATAASSSRLGVTQKNRRLPERIWSSTAGLSPRTRLLLAHFTASLSDHDPLLPLQDAELEALAGPGAEAWPIARAVSIRLLTQPSPALLRALAALGPTTAIELPPTGEKSYAQASGADHSLDPDLRAAILDEPGLYPAFWVDVAARNQSSVSEEVSMEQEALQAKWVPKVPRLLSPQVGDVPQDYAPGCSASSTPRRLRVRLLRSSHVSGLARPYHR